MNGLTELRQMITFIRNLITVLLHTDKVVEFKDYDIQYMFGLFIDGKTIHLRSSFMSTVIDELACKRNFKIKSKNISMNLNDGVVLISDDALKHIILRVWIENDKSLLKELIRLVVAR